MIHVALVCAGLLVGQTASSPHSPADLKQYEALKTKAGSDPGAHVKLALWCEAHGLGAERIKHLALAVLSDPRNAAARGLLGLVERNGRWETPEQVNKRITEDRAFTTTLSEYDHRRARLTAEDLRGQPSQTSVEPDTRSEAGARSARRKRDRRLAQAHSELARWCKSNNLNAEAIAHFSMAVHLDPDRDSSWKNLGYVMRDGRWTSRAEADLIDREEREQKQADRYWEPQIKKWKSWLGDKRKRPEAEALLAAVSDRRALPSILRAFPADYPESGQARRVRLLGQIDDPTSSRALASHAMLTRFESVRQDAIETLKKRPPRDYVGELVEMIHGMIRYQVQPISGPDSRGALAIDAPKFRTLRTYDVPHAFELHASFRGYAGYDANGLPIVVSGRELDQMRVVAGNPVAIAARVYELEARTANMLAMATETARSQMAADIETIETTNARAQNNNARIIPILQSAASAPADLTDDENAWHVWWYDTLGYRYQAAPKPTFAQDVSPQYEAPYIRTCFAAGTSVQTISGPRPIEAIEVGDQVLSQDAVTGALSFEPVLFVHRNPPDQTLRIKISGGDSVVCSIFHRFWRANSGWVQARELTAGDTLRQFGGLAKVESVDTDLVQPLFNLDVATSRTFFVGKSQLLVHDNTLPDHRMVPFDILPGLSPIGTR